MGGLHSSYIDVKSMNTESDVTLDDISPPRKVLPGDPRSPSTQISRTPIIVDKTPDADYDPRSPTPGIIRTPLFKFFKNMHILKSPSSPSTVESLPDLSAIATADTSTDVTSGPSLLDSFHLSEADDEDILLLSSPSGTVSNESGKNHNKSPKPVKPKKLFINKRSSSGRSPLRVFNHATDSPTQFVQQRQMKKVDSNIRSRRLPRGCHDDKENVQH